MPYNLYTRADRSNLSEDPGYNMLNDGVEYYENQPVALKGKGKDGTTIGVIDEMDLERSLLILMVIMFMATMMPVHLYQKILMDSKMMMDVRILIMIMMESTTLRTAVLIWLKILMGIKMMMDVRILIMIGTIFQTQMMSAPMTPKLIMAIKMMTDVQTKSLRNNTPLSIHCRGSGMLFFTN